MSNRWWRAYDEAVDDPKLCLLSDRAHRAWFNLCCITSQNGGTLPSIEAIAFKLRMTAPKAQAIVAELAAAGLLDEDETGCLAPHNWGGRQFQSDGSTPRVKRFRERQRNVSSAVSETAPDTEDRDRKKDSEPNGSGAESAAPADPRTRLFSEGLAKLAVMTGRGPDACRSLLGKWLKATQDEAIDVLAAIEDADRERVANPVPWINQRLTATAGRIERPAAKPVPGVVIRFDSPQARAWEKHNGRSFAWGQRGERTVPTEWPPGHDPPEAASNGLETHSQEQ